MRQALITGILAGFVLGPVSEPARLAGRSVVIAAHPSPSATPIVPSPAPTAKPFQGDPIIRSAEGNESQAPRLRLPKPPS